ncbi:MAG TPA: hypothetical protein VJS17_05460 [Pyrinomonadaceae bacterium]|nr:hypothetical protein [Pyrinomonadaceae bacterium]
MKTTHCILGIALLALLPATSFAQSAADCSSLMKFGIYDKYRAFTTESHYKQIKEFFENNTFSSRQQAETKAGELGLDIIGVLNLSFGGNTSSSNFDQWRQRLIRSTYQEAQSAGLSATTIETISGKLTALVEKCLAQKGVHAYVIPANDNQNFTVTVDFVPLSSDRPYTSGTITLTPSSVAAQCFPNDILGQQKQIGSQGISLSCRRSVTDTVAVIVNAQDGSPTFTYDAYVVPKPSIQFAASKDTIESGETTRLTWDVKNALRVTLMDFGQVPENGSRDVTPTASTEYKLNVTALTGEVETVSRRVTVNPPPPVLTGARVEFYTTDDNKDHNTTASVFIKCGGSLVASVSGQWGEFNDDSPSGWKQLNIIERPRKAAVIGVCTAQAREDPVGDDEWHFNWTLELTFSDGTTKSYRWDGENIAEDRRETGVKGL